MELPKKQLPRSLPRYYEPVGTFSCENSPFLGGTRGIILLSSWVWKDVNGGALEIGISCTYSNPVVTGGRKHTLSSRNCAKWKVIGNFYSGLYLKRRSHTNFNSYVVGTERETKDLHSELSLRIHSRARHRVKSPKKSKTMASRPIDYYEIISWKPVHLKSPIGFKYPYLLIRPIRCTGFYHAKQQQSNI